METRWKRNGLLLITCCLLATNRTSALASVRRQTLTRFTYTEYLMGIDARLIVYAPSKSVAEDACTAAFQRIADLDAMMSDYRPSSELMRLCDKAGGPPVKVSPELFLVLKEATKISKQSYGTFDVTVGPLVKLWRQARKTGQLPKPSNIEAARKLVGWQNILLNDKDGTVQLKLKGMRLDLGGIAKGYAGDEGIAVLKKHGIDRALVDMGGDVVMSEAPPGTNGWTVRAPNAEHDKAPVLLHLANHSISSTGDTEQFVIIGGKRYSHVVDPHTGQALTHRVQATIIYTKGLISDPLVKGLTILDKSRREKLLKLYPGAVSYVKVLPFD